MDCLTLNGIVHISGTTDKNVSLPPLVRLLNCHLDGFFVTNFICCQSQQDTFYSLHFIQLSRRDTNIPQESREFLYSTGIGLFWRMDFILVPPDLWLQCFSHTGDNCLSEEVGLVNTVIRIWKIYWYQDLLELGFANSLIEATCNHTWTQENFIFSCLLSSQNFLLFVFSITWNPLQQHFNLFPFLWMSFMCYIRICL